jgi:hypothetical protein
MVVNCLNHTASLRAERSNPEKRHTLFGIAFRYVGAKTNAPAFDYFQAWTIVFIFDVVWKLRRTGVVERS